MESTQGEITRLLLAVRGGDGGAHSELVSLIYPQLRHIAQNCIRGERSDHTLQPTALVNEAYIRMAGREFKWANRTHFFAVAAHVMRQVLVDYARHHRAAKRSGNLQKVDLNDATVISAEIPEKILSLDEALSRLAEWDPRQASVVEMRFFAGLTEEEIGEVLGISVRTVKRDWKLARAWLYSVIGR
jgi:RNA polymerase sigma-70 factor (ECF subfamily)